MNKAVIAALIMIVGSVVAVRALSRAPESAPEGPYVPRSLTPYVDLRFGSGSSPDRIEDAAIDTMLRDRLRRVETAPPLSEAAIQSLVDRARSRLRMIVGPDGPSLDEVRAADGSRSATDDELAESIEDWTGFWRGAPVSLEQSAVRFIPPRDSEESSDYRLGSSKRSPLRGQYPRHDSSLPVLEIVFATHPKAAEGNRRAPVHLAFAHQHDARDNQWKFIDCVIYVADQSVHPPAY